MPALVDIVEYHKGEHVEITLFAKDRDGTSLDSAASALVTMVISETISGSPTLTFSTVEGSITVVDAPTAKFLISLSSTKLASLVEGRTYYYNIWTGSTQKTLQASGKFSLQSSIEEV